jgi:isopenicillin-N N-acyltransferase like protein
MRLPVFALLSGLLLTCASARADVVAREGEGYLERREDGGLVLHLKGSAYDMGVQHGRLLKDVITSNIQRIVDNQGDMGKSDEYMAYRMMRPMMHDMLRKHIPERFKEEMRGLSDGSGVSYADIEAGNLFPAAFHCSGIAMRGAATHDQSLYHVRILDYMTALGLQDAALVIIHQPDGLRSWLNVGFAGFIGSVTGMNDAQVAIGEMGGGGLGYWDGLEMPFLIRDALERSSTLDEALELFRTTPRTCEYYYVISDGKTRDAVGIWATTQVFETIRPGEDYALFEGMRPRGAAADGKAFGRDMKVKVDEFRITFKGENDVEGFMALQPPDTLVMSGADRYNAFMNAMKPHYGKIDAQVLMELVKRPVSMGSNLHVAIFHPETLEVWVAVAASDGSPACDQVYRRYDLRAELAPGPK